MATKKRSKIGFLLGLGVSILIIIIYALARVSPLFNFFNILELKTVDVRMQLRGVRPPSGDVAIAVIDEKSINQLGRWPWSRAIFAQLVNKLSEAGAKVIAFDVIFGEPERHGGLTVIKKLEELYLNLGLDKTNGKNALFYEGIKELESGIDSDLRLAEAIQKAGNVVLGMFGYTTTEEIRDFDQEELESRAALIASQAYPEILDSSIDRKAFSILRAHGFLTNIPLINSAGSYAGYFNFNPDPDGTIRKSELLIQYKDKYYPTLAVQAVRLYLRKNKLQAIIREYGLEGIKIGRSFVPTDENGSFTVNFSGPEKTFPHYSIVDILRGDVEGSKLKDKIILVGPTAKGIYDLRVTPMGTIFPGVEIHANIIDNILNKNFIHHSSLEKLIDIIVILGLGLLLSLIIPRLNPTNGQIITLVCLAGFLLTAQYLFNSKGMIITMLFPALTIILSDVAMTIYKYFGEEREKKWIEGAFGLYLAPAIVQQLKDNPAMLNLGGERKVLTAFFSDVAGFSSISEKLSPEDLVHLLNIYLTEMSDLIHKYEGTIDKFEGDAIIAFYGAPVSYPDHATRACLVCLEMQQRLVELREEWRNEGKPELKVRMGLNTGPMVVGNMGSKKRFDYTIMGDAVNLAARLEGANKEYGTCIMLTDATYQAAKQDIEVRELDLLRVVGKKEPVGVYELLSRKGELDAAKAKVVTLFHEGLERYRTQHWDDAISAFEQVLSIDPMDGPAKTYLERCKLFKEDPPPADWDGVFIMKTK